MLNRIKLIKLELGIDVAVHIFDKTTTVVIHNSRSERVLLQYQTPTFLNLLIDGKLKKRTVPKPITVPKSITIIWEMVLGNYEILIEVISRSSILHKLMLPKFMHFNREAKYIQYRIEELFCNIANSDSINEVIMRDFPIQKPSFIVCREEVIKNFISKNVYIFVLGNTKWNLFYCDSNCELIKLHIEITERLKNALGKIISDKDVNKNEKQVDNFLKQIKDEHKDLLRDYITMMPPCEVLNLILNPLSKYKKKLTVLDVSGILKNVNNEDTLNFFKTLMNFVQEKPKLIKHFWLANLEKTPLEVFTGESTGLTGLTPIKKTYPSKFTGLLQIYQKNNSKISTTIHFHNYTKNPNSIKYKYLQQLHSSQNCKPKCT